MCGLLLPLPRMRLAKGLYARRIGAVTTQFIKERVGLPKHCYEAMYCYSFLLAAAGLIVLTAAGSLAARKREPSVNDVRQGRAPRAYYTADWAVEITAGGAKMADVIAKRNGFTNLGEV